MSNNPLTGRVPLNLRQGDAATIEKSASSATSFRSGETHKPEYRSQYNDRTILPRNVGCTPLRRYPNGTLDFKYVAGQIIDIVHKVKDNGNITEIERAILALVLPGKFHSLVDAKIAQTMTKLSKDERMMLALMVEQHTREELNWNAGAGGGSVPGRSTTRS